MIPKHGPNRTVLAEEQRSNDVPKKKRQHDRKGSSGKGLKRGLK